MHNLEFKMATNSLSDEMIEALSSEIDKLFKDIELKYWGLLPWDAISEKLAVKDFFRKLSHAKKNAIIAHSSKYTSEQKLASTSSVCLHGMACSELSFWTKSILRRMYFTVKHSHPWMIVLSSRLPKPIFDYIIEVLTCSSSFSVSINDTHLAKGRAKKERIVRITNKRKLYQLLCTGVDGNDELNFKKNVAGKGHVDLIVSENKPFVITYSYVKENVNIMCHYGSWNTNGVPQFI